MFSMRMVYRIIGVYCALVVGGVIAAGQSSNMPVTPWQALKQSRYVKPALGVAGVLTAAALTALLVRSHQKSSKNNLSSKRKLPSFEDMSTPVSADSTPINSQSSSPRSYSRKLSVDEDEDDEVIIDFSGITPARDISPEEKENILKAYFDRYMQQDNSDLSIGYIPADILYSKLYASLKQQEIRHPISRFFSRCSVLSQHKNRCCITGQDIVHLFEIFKMIPYVRHYLSEDGTIAIPAIIGFSDINQQYYYIGLIDAYDICLVFDEKGSKKVLQSNECFFGDNEALVFFCIASKQFSDSYA